MTLPASGNLTMAQVAAELGIGLPLELGDSRVRTLAGVPSGPISMSNLYGKSAGAPPPAPTPLSVQVQDGSGYAESSSASGTVSCQVTATVTGGTGAITHLWEFISNPGQATLSNSNSASARVSRNYARYSSGSADAQLRYTARDSTGAQVVAQPVTATLEWNSGQFA